MKYKIVVLSIFFITISSSASISLKNFAPTGGIIYPGNSWKIGYQAGAMGNIVQFSEDLNLFLLLNYWESKSSKEYIRDLTFSNLAYGFDLRYNIKPKGLYFGFGVVHNNLYKDYKTSGIPSDPINRIGGSVFTGYNFSYDGYNSFFTELKYSRVNEYNILGLKFGLYFHMTGKESRIE